MIANATSVKLREFVSRSLHDNPDGFPTSNYVLQELAVIWNDLETHALCLLRKSPYESRITTDELLSEVMNRFLCKRDRYEPQQGSLLSYLKGFLKKVLLELGRKAKQPGKGIGWAVDPIDPMDSGSDPGGDSGIPNLGYIPDLNPFEKDLIRHLSDEPDTHGKYKRIADSLNVPPRSLLRRRNALKAKIRHAIESGSIEKWWGEWIRQNSDNVAGHGIVTRWAGSINQLEWIQWCLAKGSVTVSERYLLSVLMALDYHGLHYPWVIATATQLAHSLSRFADDLRCQVLISLGVFIGHSALIEFRIGRSASIPKVSSLFNEAMGRIQQGIRSAENFGELLCCALGHYQMASMICNFESFKIRIGQDYDGSLLQDAKSHLERACECDPCITLGIEHQLGVIALIKKEVDCAIERFEKSLDQSSEQSRKCYDLRRHAAALILRKDFDAALCEYARAIGEAIQTKFLRYSSCIIDDLDDCLWKEDIRLSQWHEVFERAGQPA